MSAEPPSGWDQACPRSVRLAPDGLLVPAGTLDVLLRGGRRLPLVYTGHALEPWVRDGEGLLVAGGAAPRRGALILCNRGGWGDLLRVVRPAPGGGWIATLDAFPRRRAIVPADAVLGAVVEPERARRALLGRFWRASGLGAACFAWRRIACAPAWVGDPTDSVLEKYRSQVGSYSDARLSNLGPEHVAAIARHARPGDAVLVVGCGAGGEVVHLARAGYRVTGVDALPEMIEAARRVAADAGITARFEVADLRQVDGSGPRYRAIYLTPLLYSFVAGKERRVTLLRSLAARLEPGGCLLFSAQIHRGAWSWLQTRIAAWRRPPAAWGGEPGDWYTWYLTPHGLVACSFLRRFSAGEVLAEAGAAGLRPVTRLGVHFLATGAGAG